MGKMAVAEVHLKSFILMLSGYGVTYVLRCNCDSHQPF